MGKKHDFIIRLESLSDAWFRLVRQFETFNLHKRSNIPTIKEKVSDFSSRFLSSTDEMEQLIKCKSQSELSDSYFFHMRTMELKTLEKKLDKFEREFRELDEWVDRERDEYTEKQVAHEMDLFGQSSKPKGILYDVHDDDYEQLMIIFVQEHLKFYCPDCNKPIPFGDDRCDYCDSKQDWWYDIDETLARLEKRALRNPEFHCPNKGCGAMIQLDWENCAFCGLKIQKMLHTMIYFS